MAQISIYGTLVNDTGEPIANADQIYDRESGKMLSEIIRDGIGGGGSVIDGEEFTADDVAEWINELF